MSNHSLTTLMYLLVVPGACFTGGANGHFCGRRFWAFSWTMQFATPIVGNGFTDGIIGYTISSIRTVSQMMLLVVEVFVLIVDHSGVFVLNQSRGEARISRGISIETSFWSRLLFAKPHIFHLISTPYVSMYIWCTMLLF